MQNFFQGVDRSLNFIEKDRKQRAKIKAAKKAEKAERTKKIYRLKDSESKRDDRIKRTGRIHVVSKRIQTEPEQANPAE